MFSRLILINLKVQSLQFPSLFLSFFSLIATFNRSDGIKDRKATWLRDALIIGRPAEIAEARKKEGERRRDEFRCSQHERVLVHARKHARTHAY